MYFLGVLLVVSIYWLAWCIGGGGLENPGWVEYLLSPIPANWQPMAAGCVVGAFVVHAAIFGRKHLAVGFRSLLRQSNVSRPETAEYFRALSRFMFLLACLCFFGGCVLGIVSGTNPQQRGSGPHLGMLCMIYTIALYLFVLWPIVNRCETKSPAHGNGETKISFPVQLTLYGILSFFLLRFLLASTYLQFLSRNPNASGMVDSYFDWSSALVWLTLFSFNPAELESYPFALVSYFDVPSLVVVLATMGFLRMMAGPLKNRYEAVPVCLLQGIFWTFLGLLIMFSDLNEKTFSSGAQISMLTSLYGIILGISYFFKDRRVQALFLLSFPMVVLLPLYPYVIVVTLIGAAPFEVFAFYSVAFWAFFVPYVLLIRSLLRDRKKRLENQNAEEPLPEQAQAARDTLEKAIQIQRERKL